MPTHFHTGELAVQERAGVRDQADRVGRGIHPAIPPPAREFLSAQPLAILGAMAGDGRVWASPLSGDPGFMAAVDAHSVAIDARPPAGDPLAAGLDQETGVGLLVMDPATRRRLRLNGTARLRPGGGLLLRAAQVYANCPKYIQAREWYMAQDPAGPGQPRRSFSLDREQRRWIAGADTFFIASHHPEAGADASHRGGNPGFVQVLDARRLAWRDYPGNNMFQTLGNLWASPRAGLLFLDFERGHSLQLTGSARVVWDGRRAAASDTVERRVEFEIETAVQIAAATRLRYRFMGYSPFNPAEGAAAAQPGGVP